jgi:hypothetical protein
VLEALGGAAPDALIVFASPVYDHPALLSALASALGPTPYAGCNTYGQIARAEGQFGGFHNCTAVVCVLPE